MSFVVNLGVAGALDRSLDIEQVVPIRTLYGQDAFHSYTTATLKSQQAKHDLISTHERITDPDRAAFFQVIAPIVDREAYALSQVCHFWHKPFLCFKYLSDYADSANICQDVRAKSRIYSLKLYEAVIKQKLLTHIPSTPLKLIHNDQDHWPVVLEKLKHLGFYFTQAQSRRGQKLMSQLSRAYDISYTQVLDLFPMELVRTKEITPKDKTRLLLATFEGRLSPFKAKLERNMSKFVKSFQASATSFRWQEHLEAGQFELKTRIQSESQWKAFVKSVNHFNYSDFQKIVEGDLHEDS